MSECVAGQTHTVKISVYDATSFASGLGIAKMDPAIDSADFEISVNGNTWQAIDNAPTVEPAGSEIIKIVLSAAETSAAAAGGDIAVRVVDASNDGGWIGGVVCIPVRGSATSTLTAAQVNAEVDTAIGDAALATQASVNTLAGYVDTEVAAIKAVTDALPNAGALTTITNNVAAILTDTNELQTDLTNGGRVDLLIDAIKAVTDLLPDGGALTTLLANIAAILADTGTDGVVIASGSKAGYELADGAITAAKISTDAVTKIQDGLPTGRPDVGFS